MMPKSGLWATTAVPGWFDFDSIEKRGNFRRGYMAVFGCGPSSGR